MSDIQNSPEIQPSPAQELAPGRGGLILGLSLGSLIASICSCCLCFPLFLIGIAPIIMGASDLKQMKAGTMDMKDYGKTQAGFIIGIICVVLFSLMVLSSIFSFIANPNYIQDAIKQFETLSY